MRSYNRFVQFLALPLILLLSSCLPSAPSAGADSPTITVYGFSIMKEALEKDIYPAFADKWKREHGVSVNFVSSFAGSETVTNQILQGASADVAVLSIERDADRLLSQRQNEVVKHTQGQHNLREKNVSFFVNACEVS